MNGRLPAARARARAAVVALALSWAIGASAATAPGAAPSTRKPTTTAKPSTTTPSTKRRPAAKRAAGSTKSVLELARETREIEDAGAYARAVSGLRALRARVIRDADLDLFLALDEARSGLVDSARVHLRSRLMDDAVKDTLPIARRVEYPYRREGAWLNGHYDGWPWYIWRARGEVAAATGHWQEAYEAAQQCVAARPLTGKEWLLLALAAGKLERADESRQAAARAASLDPTLPEAHYLWGLWEWKQGHRSEAQQAFRRATVADSSFVPAALAMMRSRIPGIGADSLPDEFLTGRRRAGMVTAPDGPKPEEYVQVDVSALISYAAEGAVEDSIPPSVKPVTLILSLLIDEQGRPVINDLPWFPFGILPEWKITRLLAAVPSWRFTPAIKLGSPHAVWVSMEFKYLPPTGDPSVRKD